LKAGYHNINANSHRLKISGPIELLAKNTKSSVMLQLDVGTCLEAGSDPVAWILANPGRIRSLHLKDWSPIRESYKVFSEKERAIGKHFCRSGEHGGVEYYLMEQEGRPILRTRHGPACLQNFRLRIQTEASTSPSG